MNTTGPRVPLRSDVGDGTVTFESGIAPLGDASVADACCFSRRRPTRASRGRGFWGGASGLRHDRCFTGGSHVLSILSLYAIAATCKPLVLGEKEKTSCSSASYPSRRSSCRPHFRFVASLDFDWPRARDARVVGLPSLNRRDVCRRSLGVVPRRVRRRKRRMPAAPFGHFAWLGAAVKNAREGRSRHIV